MRTARSLALERLSAVLGDDVATEHLPAEEAAPEPPVEPGLSPQDVADLEGVLGKLTG